MIMNTDPARCRATHERGTLTTLHRRIARREWLDLMSTRVGKFQKFKAQTGLAYNLCRCDEQ